MKETLPAKASVSQTPAAPAGATRHRFSVRFYRRMRLKGVYPAVVWARTLEGKPGGHRPVALRAVVPGALVTPAEQSLNLGDPRAAATFYVTPLARGRLPDARIEIHHQGSVLQTIRLPMRATTQRLTWVLAFLTLGLPAFFLYTTVYHRMKGMVPQTFVIRPIPPPAGANPAQPNDQRKEDLPPPPVNPAPGQPPTAQAPSLDGLVRSLIGLVDGTGSGQQKNDSMEPKDEDRPEPGKADEKKDREPRKEAELAPTPRKAPAEEKQDRPAGGGLPPEKGRGRDAKKPPPEGGGPIPNDAAARPDAEPQAMAQTGPRDRNAYERPGQPGELLERAIRDQIPEVPDAWQEHFPWLPPLARLVARGAGVVYEFACALAVDHLSFWVGVVFLALTIGSLVTHRSVRGKRSGKPIVLSA
jgi:hypothetical protein